MEHYALEILQCKDGQVAQRYREQFTEIMVDEFQDSNDVQNTLVQSICRENNVFRVVILNNPFMVSDMPNLL